MKTIKNIFIAIAATALVMPLFNGCKKGAEDPFLSLKSREKRIEGTWTLKSVDYTYTSETKSNTNNTVNSDNSTSSDNTTYTVAYDGSNMTVIKKSAPSSTNYTSNYKQYDAFANPPAYKSVTTSSVESKTETWVTSYAITVSIYKDNTYSYTITKKATSYSRSTARTVNGIAVTPSPKDTSIAGTYDGINYYSTNEDTKTKVGTWSWADELEKSDIGKIIINAGPLSGYLLRLSNKELIIDYSYSGLFGSNNYFIDDPAFQNAMTEDNNTNKVQNAQVSEDTYNNSSPYTFANGTETTTTTVVKKVVSGKSTWEKTDKKRKRDEEASAE